MMLNADTAEIAKFADAAHDWWDPEGGFRTLHQINPLRVDWICSFTQVADRDVLDIGCGGGLLAEALAGRGARVTGIDLAEKSLKVAGLHAMESGLDIDYRAVPAEELAMAQPASFDVVCCLEMLEHVPRPASVVAAAAELVRPGGWVFFSTINRNPKSWALAIVAAEHLLRLLPAGTHDWSRFIRPSELASWARDAGLEPVAFRGIGLAPLEQRFRLVDDVDVNYLLACRKLP